MGRKKTTAVSGRGGTGIAENSHSVSVDGGGKARSPKTGESISEEEHAIRDIISGRKTTRDVKEERRIYRRLPGVDYFVANMVLAGGVSGPPRPNRFRLKEVEDALERDEAWWPIGWQRSPKKAKPGADADPVDPATGLPPVDPVTGLPAGVSGIQAAAFSTAGLPEGARPVLVHANFFHTGKVTIMGTVNEEMNRDVTDSIDSLMRGQRVKGFPAGGFDFRVSDVVLSGSFDRQIDTEKANKMYRDFSIENGTLMLRSPDFPPSVMLYKGGKSTPGATFIWTGHKPGDPEKLDVMVKALRDELERRDVFVGE